MRHLELAAQQSKKVTREEAVANAKATAEQLGKQLPICLDNGVTVVRYAPYSPCGNKSLSQHGTYLFMQHCRAFYFVCRSVSVYRSVWAAWQIIFAGCVDICLLNHMLAAGVKSCIVHSNRQGIPPQASKSQRALHRGTTASPITMQMQSERFAAVPITMQLQWDCIAVPLQAGQD